MNFCTIRQAVGVRCKTPPKLTGIKTDQEDKNQDRETLRQRLEEIKTKKWVRREPRKNLEGRGPSHRVISRAIKRSWGWAWPRMFGVGLDRIQDQIEFVGAIDFA